MQFSVEQDPVYDWEPSLGIFTHLPQLPFRAKGPALRAGGRSLNLQAQG